MSDYAVRSKLLRQESQDSTLECHTPKPPLCFLEMLIFHREEGDVERGKHGQRKADSSVMGREVQHSGRNDLNRVRKESSKGNGAGAGGQQPEPTAEQGGREESPLYIWSGRFSALALTDILGRQYSILL